MVAVTTLLRPAGVTPKAVISYQIAEDASAPQCAPSYVLRQDSPSGELINQAAILLIDAAVAQGYAVSVPDSDASAAPDTLRRVRHRTACHLNREDTGRDYAILERRSSDGGTWDLFRYPDIRSDSDMYTFGFGFNPWHGTKILADGPHVTMVQRSPTYILGLPRIDPVSAALNRTLAGAAG